MLASMVCEEKHIGSRAVVVLCRDEAAARERFGVVGEGVDVVVTHTGRRFFDDAEVVRAPLEVIGRAIEQSGTL